MPLASYNHRNQFQTNCIARSPVGSHPRTTPLPGAARRLFAPRRAILRSLLAVLLVHFLRELRRLDAVLLLELLDEAGLVPVGHRFRHEIGERLLPLLDGETPGLDQDGIERH